MAKILLSLTTKPTHCSIVSESSVALSYRSAAAMYHDCTFIHTHAYKEVTSVSSLYTFTRRSRRSKNSRGFHDNPCQEPIRQLGTAGVTNKTRFPLDDVTSRSDGSQPGALHASLPLRHNLWPRKGTAEPFLGNIGKGEEDENTAAVPRLLYPTVDTPSTYRNAGLP